MDFEPISKIYQDIGNAIRAGDPRLAQIDVSRLGFLTQEDLPPVVLPLQQNPPLVVQPLHQVLPEATTIGEEIASSNSSLEEEIDKFHFEDKETQGVQVIHISDAEGDSDKHLSVHTSILVVTHPNKSSEEKDEMALNRGGKGLRELLATRNTGSTSKEAPKSKLPPTLPPPPSLPPIDIGLHTNPNLKKKRTMQELEEWEVPPQKGTKQQKTTKDPKEKRASSADSREELNGADVCLQQRTWSPKLEVDGAIIPWTASVRGF